MKISFTLIVLLIVSNIGYCQKDSTQSNPFLNSIKPLPTYPKYPNSWLNIGLGTGSNYGGMGIKAVFGFKNSGLTVGVGTNGAQQYLSYNIGFQVSYKFLYTSFTYGSYPSCMEIKNGGYSIPYGFHNVIGVMIGLGKLKRNFIDVGVEISYGGYVLGNVNILSGASGSIGTSFYTDENAKLAYTGINKLGLVNIGLVLGYGYRIGNKNIWKKQW